MFFLTLNDRITIEMIQTKLMFFFIYFNLRLIEIRAKLRLDLESVGLKKNIQNGCDDIITFECSKSEKKVLSKYRR